MSAAVERSESVDNVCPVCHDLMEIFAIGPCDHAVCSRCSTRMRVLCEQLDCPICRSQMPQVAFVYKKSQFKDISLRDCIPNRKYKIFFEDKDVEDSFLELLEFRCKMPSCQNRAPERTFAQLQTHMRRDHQLFACDLCVSHLRIFPFERKFYNRKNLAVHRRVGDEDDKSYKGHPLCEFCDTRYNDKDELLRHLRKDHFFCHFCDQQGSNTYYDQYQDLVKHFSESHFLCTDGECGNLSTRFTHAFASEIDLKAHRASAHNKNLSKAQSREARTIELDFQTSRRRQGANRDDFDDRQAVGGRGRGDRYNRHRDHDSEDVDLYRAIEASKEAARTDTVPVVEERVPDPVADFPALNGAVVPVSAVSITKPVRDPEEDFPSLSATRSNKQQAQPQVKAYSTVTTRQVDTKPSVPVAKESKPVLLGSISRNREYPRSVPKNTEDEYPSLSGSSASHKPHVSETVHKISRESVLKKSDNEYPCLGGGLSSNKASSVGSLSKISREYSSSVPTTSEDQYPALGGSQSSNKPATLGAVSTFSREFSSMPTKFEDEYPSLSGNSSVHKPALLGSVVKMSRDYSNSVPQNSEVEYPSLGGRTSPQSLVPQTGSVNWVKRSQASNVVVSSVSSPHTKNKNQKQKGSQNLETLVKDDNQFPQLIVGGPQRNVGVFRHSSPEWGKQASASSSGKKKLRSEKYDDESFELPESYQRSCDEATNEGNVHMVKAVSAGISGVALAEKKYQKPAPVNNTEEFPGLPARTGTTHSKDDGKKKKKVKKENVKAKPPQDKNACLGDIALTLMLQTNDSNDDKTISARDYKTMPVRDSKTTVPSKDSKTSSKPQLLDWFDNPIDVTTDLLSKTNDYRTDEVTSIAVDDSSSFPSLHSMSASIQQPKPPPGFAVSTQPVGVAAVSAPPGFASSAPSTPVALSSFSSTPPGFSPNITYTQPLDFRTRNLQLIEDIRQALMTVEEGFSNFRVLSGQFRQGLMDASNYYTNCQALMGDEEFEKVFPELLVLLPDISKQQELWQCHQAFTKTPPISKLCECPVCGQLLLVQDLSYHELQHASSSHFPLLNDVNKSTVTSSNGVGPDMRIKEPWIKAK